MKNMIWSLFLMLFLAGCGVDWFPATTPPPTSATETVTASAGGPYTQTGLSTTAIPISIVLSGSGSSSKGSPVTFLWTVTSANASSATLTAATTATPTFSATAAGEYSVQLKVTSSTDTTKSATTSATVTVRATSATITAFAGGPRTQNGPSATITLTGSGSSSTGETSFTYQWTVASQPTGAHFTFGTPTAATTTFNGDLVGDYQVQLAVTSVSDPTVTNLSLPALITVQQQQATELVTASIANGATVTVDGTGEANAVKLNGSVNFVVGPVTVAWAASGSNAANASFGSPSQPVTTFFASAPGTYNVSLTATSTSDPSKTATSTTVVTVLDDTLPGGKGSYFPLTKLAPSGVQRTWTYRYTNGTIETVYVSADNTLTHNLQTDPVTLSQTIFGLPGAGGVLLTSIVSTSSSSTYSPGLPIFPKNTSGGTETTDYTVQVGSAQATRQATIGALGVETVVVPAGTFNNALHITATTTSTSEGNLPADAWYVQGIGLVKDTNKQLTSYTK